MDCDLGEMDTTPLAASKLKGDQPSQRTKKTTILLVTIMLLVMIVLLDYVLNYKYIRYYTAKKRQKDFILESSTASSIADTNIITENQEKGYADLRIIILCSSTGDDNTNNHLKETLNSLNEALYGKDRADIDIWINNDVALSNHHLNERVKECLEFQWHYGIKGCHVYHEVVGQRDMWLDSWEASVPGGLRNGLKETVLLLNDHTLVSKHFWGWLKTVHETYGTRPEVAGFSLSALDYVSAPVDERSKKDILYFFELSRNVGFSPTVNHWRKFTKYGKSTESDEAISNSTRSLNIKASESPHPLIVQKTEELKADESCPGFNCPWEKFHHLYTASHVDRYTVYPFLPNKLALAVDSSKGNENSLLKNLNDAREMFDVPAAPPILDFNGSRHSDTFIEYAVSMSRFNGFVNIQILNRGFVKMTKHWICNARAIGNILDKTLFITTDQAAHDELVAFGDDLHVVLEVFGDDSDMSYGQVRYFKMMLWRTNLILRILDAGANLFLTEADAVWLKNPFEILNLQSVTDDILVMDDKPPEKGPQGGFMFLRATVQARKAWKTVLDLQTEAMRPAIEGTSSDLDFIGEQGNEQHIEKQVFHELVEAGQLNIAWMDSEMFCPGKWYNNNQMHSPKNAVILFNWIVGSKNKILRAKKYHHWYLTRRDTCRQRTFYGL